VTHGRYLVVFGGSTAATAESLAEALATSGKAVIDHTLLPDVHPALFEAAFGARISTRSTAATHARRLVSSNCGGSMKIVAFLTDGKVIRAILASMRKSAALAFPPGSRPPSLSLARL
jgi:hypothetical protein